MKKVLTLIALVVFTLIGCQEADNPLSPVTDTNIQKYDDAQPNWITLPKSTNMSIEKNFSSKKNINGKIGGEVRVKAEYEGGIYGLVKIDARIQFPKNAFWSKKDITLSIDSQNGLTTFFPHMKFNKSAIYDLKIEGLDLRDVDVDNIDFVYQSPVGSIERVKYDKIKVDKSKGYIEVQKAHLNHFSRYGFVN